MGHEGLAKIMKNTEPYIRTKNKRRQIEKCKRKLAVPRRRLQEKAIRPKMLQGVKVQPVAERIRGIYCQICQSGLPVHLNGKIWPTNL